MAQTQKSHNNVMLSYNLLKVFTMAPTMKHITLQFTMVYAGGGD